MNLLDGKVCAQFYKDQIKAEAEQLTAHRGRKPHLAVILVGENPASQSYVRSKVRNCALVGFESTLIEYPASISETELLSKIQEINLNEAIDGLLVQLPLPKHINEFKVLESIDHRKDVDGFHPINAGRMNLGLPSLLPATPYGILLLLSYYKIETAGKHCVVIGRSNIVGNPMSRLLSRNTNPGNCTVTQCHSKTQNIRDICQSADILIAAIGKAEFVDDSFIKQGAVIIDVGINRIDDASLAKGYKLVGDVHFHKASPKASYITPVPGGVGLMTIVGLLKNTLAAAKKEIYS
jgi:methylenetetrahydrofolate dehydrogenase (NADP+) / methenyltetrahydrofolate cyclohydrolase